MASQDNNPQHGNLSPEITAAHIPREIRLDAEHPAADWQNTSPIVFCTDWQGKNPDPGRETKARVLWSGETLYLRFECRFYEFFLFSDAEANGHHDHLWERDVAEAFLQPDSSRALCYREFEISPNGMWLDLDIFPGGRADLQSGLQRSVSVNKRDQTWAAEMAIPLRALTPHFDPRAVWRANFFRVEGSKEPRTYLAWQPTKTPQPNFHVPSAFGRLRFLNPA